MRPRPFNARSFQYVRQVDRVARPLAVLLWLRIIGAVALVLMAVLLALVGA